MKHIGNLLLSIWLILFGLKAVIDLHFRYDNIVLGAIALAAGVLLIFRR